MSLKTNGFRYLTIIWALLVMSAFTLSPAHAEIDPYRLEPIATVDGIKITRLALDNAVATLLPYVSLHKSVSERRYEKTRKDALAQLINIELIYKDAIKGKRDKVDKSIIEDRIETLKKRIPKGQTLKSVLKNSNMTMNDLRESLHKTYVIRREKDNKKKELENAVEKTVNRAYMKRYYVKNLEKFKEPKKIHLKNILLKVDPSGGPKAWKKTRKQALDILKQARSGTDFATLAKKYSQGPNAAKGGDMGWAHEGSILEELDHAASNLKKGEISEPIMTLYGYHLIQLIDSKPMIQKKFDDLNLKRLKKQLEKKEYKIRHKAWLEGLRNNAEIVIIVKDLY